MADGENAKYGLYRNHSIITDNLADGNYEYYVRCTSAINPGVSETSFKFGIDTGAPQSWLKYGLDLREDFDTGKSWYGATNVSFNCTDSPLFPYAELPGNAKCDYTIWCEDKTAVPSQCTPTLIEDYDPDTIVRHEAKTTRWICLHGVDQAENREARQCFFMRIDGVPPAVTLTSPADKLVTNIDSTSFAGTIIETQSGVKQVQVRIYNFTGGVFNLEHNTSINRSTLDSNSVRATNKNIKCDKNFFQKET